MVEEIVKNYLGLEFFDIKKLNIGSQNKTYVVSDEYIVKVFNSDMISNNDDLLIRETKEKVCDYFNQNGINSLVAFKTNGTFIQKYNDSYFCVYPYVNYKILSNKDLTEERIINLSKQVRKMHNINWNIILPENQDKIISFNIDNYLKTLSSKNKDNKIYEFILNNKLFINDLIKNINYSIVNLKSNKVITHNDLKNENILWDNDIPYFLDYDACSYSNKYCALNEYAYFFCHDNGELNKKLYELYLHYSLINDQDIDDVFSIFYGTLYGKMNWLIYSFDRYLSEDEEESNEGEKCIYGMIDTFKKYLNDKEYIYSVFEKYIR